MAEKKRIPRRRYRRTPKAVRDQIAALAAADTEMTASEISDALSEMDLPGEPPHPRVIQQIAASARPRRSEDAWSLADPRTPDDEARAVLQSLGAIKTTNRGPIGLSVSEAAWIGRLARIADWLTAYERVIFARRFVAAEEQDAPLDDLTVELARTRRVPPDEASQSWNAAIRRAVTAIKARREAEQSGDSADEEDNDGN